MAKKTETFENQLKRLEEIVRALEGGELPLDDSLRLFEEGVKLSRACHDKLGQAERKVELLLETAGGQLRTEAFAEEAGAGEDDDFGGEESDDDY
jgi:exodeoxyribonuclease VII small subunit